MALEVLLAHYWKPLYYYVRRKNQDSESAKDAVQGFLARLLEKDFLAALDPNKGRLRSYLLGAIDHYLADEWDRASALKRGGALERVPMDFDIAESQLSNTPPSPEDAYNYGWALGVLERGMERLRKEFESGERKGPFELVQKLFGLGDMPTYEEAAVQYEMSMPQLKSFLHRSRARFRKILLEEVSSTVGRAEDSGEELSELLGLLGR